MTLVLEVPAETAEQLREAARLAGRQVEQFVLEVATEQLLTLEEVGQRLNVSAGYVQDLITLELLDFRVVGGQKRVSSLDLERYQHAVRTDPNKAMDEMVGMNQLWGLYDE